MLRGLPDQIQAPPANTGRYLRIDVLANSPACTKGSLSAKASGVGVVLRLDDQHGTVLPALLVEQRTAAHDARQNLLQIGKMRRARIAPQVEAVGLVTPDHDEQQKYVPPKTIS